MNKLLKNIKNIFKNKIKLDHIDSDIYIISGIPINDFLLILSNYYKFKIIQKGKKKAEIKIGKNINLNIWHVKDNQKSGGDLFQNIANNYRKLFCNGKARTLYEGEIHPFCANFLGPGTNINKPDVINYPPFSCSDKVAKQHDLDYLAAWDLPKEEKQIKIREADNKMLRDLEKCKNDFPYYEIGKYGISSKKYIEDNLPINILPESYKGKDKGGCMECQCFKGGCINKKCKCNKGGCFNKKCKCYK
jgi:hypothetical protein